MHFVKKDGKLNYTFVPTLQQINGNVIKLSGPEVINKIGLIQPPQVNRLFQIEIHSCFRILRP